MAKRYKRQQKKRSREDTDDAISARDNGGKRLADGDRPGETTATTRAAGYVTAVRENEAFRSYYADNIIPAAEWDHFWAAVHAPLPTTFRITGSRAQAEELRDFLQTEFVDKMSAASKAAAATLTTVTGGKEAAEAVARPAAAGQEAAEAVAQLAAAGQEAAEAVAQPAAPPRVLAWYPHGLAWEFDTSRGQLKRDPALKKFRDFLIAETEVGNVSRQEAVSMLPPLLLDVEPHHMVLDMCAAPGSKTAQLLEAMHTDCTLPTGAVVANDVDAKRCYLLVRQAGRLKSPSLLVTSHDATMFPTIYDDACTPILFDRILCDVPCTGDGTIRKNPGIWKSWTTGNAMGLHRMQLQILHRAIGLLKKDGIIVYSTCSMNPIENEAVVAAALRAHPEFELVDVSERLPGLIRHAGMSTWHMVNEKGASVGSMADVADIQNSKLKTTMFPPDASEAAMMHLERSIRIYPHLQNTGGFFVAVLRRRASVSAVASATGVAVNKEINQVGDAADTTIDEILSSGATGIDSSTKIVSKTRAWKESPFVILDKESPNLMPFRSSFGIADDFPADQFLVRTETEAVYNTVYFVSESVKRVVIHGASRLSIVNTGVRAFEQCPPPKDRRDNAVSEKQTSETNGDATASIVPTTPVHRLFDDVLPVIAPHLSDKKKIRVGYEDILLCLEGSYPKFDDFPSVDVREKLKAMEYGGCVFEYDPAAEASAHPVMKSVVLLSVWRAHVSVNALLSKQDRQSLLVRLNAARDDDSAVVDRPEL